MQQLACVNEVPFRDPGTDLGVLSHRPRAGSVLLWMRTSNRFQHPWTAASRKCGRERYTGVHVGYSEDFGPLQSCCSTPHSPSAQWPSCNEVPGRSRRTTRYTTTSCQITVTLWPCRLSAESPWRTGCHDLVVFSYMVILCEQLQPVGPVDRANVSLDY